MFRCSHTIIRERITRASKTLEDLMIHYPKKKNRKI